MTVRWLSLERWREADGQDLPGDPGAGKLLFATPAGAHEAEVMFTWSPIVVLAVALMTSTPATGQSSSKPSSPAPRVFVFTAEPRTSTPTEEEQGRLDSVKDVREALAHKAGLAMAPTAGESTVQIEVMEREKREAGIGGFGGTSVTPQGEVILRLHLKFGEHETDVKGIAPGYWGRAAKDAADRAFKWIVRIDNMPPRKQ